MKHFLSGIFVSTILVFGACKKDKASDRCPLPSSDWNYSGSVLFNGESITFSNLLVTLDSSDSNESIGFSMSKNNGADDIRFFIYPMQIGDSVMIGNGSDAVSTAFMEFTCTDTHNFDNNCVMSPETLSKGFAEKVGDNRYKISFSSVFKVDLTTGQAQTACRIGSSHYSEMTVEVDIVLTPPL